MGKKDFFCASLAVLLIVIAYCETTHGCSANLDGKLILAEDGRISRVNPSNPEDNEILLKGVNPLSLDYSYSRNTLYYSDLTTGQILALEEKSKKPIVIVQTQKKWSPTAIAVDDVSDKLYIADAYAGTVGILDLRTDNYGIILGTNLTQPKRIVVDSQSGYLFIIDKFQVLRTDLDGSNPLTIYTEDSNLDSILESLPPSFDSLNPERIPIVPKFNLPVSIGDLIVDTASKRLFWVSTFTRKLESANYDGQDRKVHFHDGSSSGEFDNFFTSLTFLDGKLYWADEHLNKVFKINVNNASDFEVILNGLAIHSVKAVSCSNHYTGHNPCGSDNGQCQYLCIRTKVNNDGFKCICNVGSKLTKDGKSCRSIQDFILFVQDEYVKGVSLSAKGEFSANIIAASKFKVGSNTILDYSSKDELIFSTSDFPNNQIHQINIATGEQKKLLPDFMSIATHNLAFDWISQNLYYVTHYYADVMTLSVVNIRDPSYSKILLKLESSLIRGIAVHPNSGYVYFATSGNDDKSTISRIATDGSGLKVIIQLSYFIGGFTIDSIDNKLYWTEVKQDGGPSRYYNVLHHSNLVGDDIKQFNLLNYMQSVKFLSIDKTYIYFIYNEKTLDRINKKTGNVEMITNVGYSSSLSGLKVYSQELQIIKPGHPCITHDCQKFCFAVPNENGNLLRVCGCPYGQKIHIDGKSCVDNSKEEPPLVPCKFTSFKCKMQTKTVA